MMYNDVYKIGDDNMPRIRTNLILDSEFKKFLDYLKDKTGTPISRIVEIAALEKYKDEYQQFMECQKASQKED